MLTFRDMSMTEYTKIAEDLERLESNLTVLALVSLLDPLRAEVPASIQ